MSDILPDADETNSGWNTKNHYFYEIKNNEYFPSRQQKENWKWRTPFTTKVVKIDEETSEEKIFEQLDKKWEKIKAFEKN